MFFHSARVEAKNAGLRLDLFLVRSLPGVTWGDRLSRAEIQRIIAEGHVRLNGLQAKPSSRLRRHDLVEVEWTPPRETAILPQPLALDVLYEDEDCIVVNKPPGMVVHPAAGISCGTLVNALLFHCAGLRGIGGEKRPGIIHRLDKDTSGVMVVAKHGVAFQSLAEQFKQRTVRKEYLALVWGKPDQAAGTIDRPVGRHPTNRKKMSSRITAGRCRDAFTEWKLEQCFNVSAASIWKLQVSLLRLMPRTGRTHQIRVHLADEKFPIVGDSLYGLSRSALSRLGSRGLETAGLFDFPRQALHAQKLSFAHPCLGRPLEFCAPLPSDLGELVGKLRAAAQTIKLEKEAEGIDKKIAFP
jgi:23S rRNA pseudouridine1911/1915/1917 synthase